MTRALITGATGFVGRALLAMPSAIEWRAAVRRQPIPGLAPDQVVLGDIDGRTDWSQALSDIDCVVHLAARVHVMRPAANDRIEFDRTNVVGTERLARAAAQAGVKRFVFLSSIKVNGESTPGRAFRANDIPRPQDAYAHSKFEAEQRLSAIGAGSGMAVALVRSPLVYGPGVSANFLRLLSLAHSGLPLPLASIDNKRSMVGIWNLCDLICALLRHELPMDGVFLVADGQDISTPELVRGLARMMQRPDRLFPLPPVLLRLLAKAIGRTAEVNRLCDSLAIDIADTRTRLGWSPPQTLEAGLNTTADWYLQKIKSHGAR